MRNIKEIRAEMSRLRDEYEARITMLEEEIVAVREARGYVPKTPAYEPYYEAGRSEMPTPSGGMGARPAYYDREGGSMCNGLGRSYF